MAAGSRRSRPAAPACRYKGGHRPPVGRGGARPSVKSLHTDVRPFTEALWSSTPAAYLASLAGLAPLRPPPSKHTALTKLLPVSLSFAASLFLGNVAYLGLSVAFINIMKAATPMVTLALGLALRLERLSKLTLLATLLIALGTYTATASEAASRHFHWLSFLAFSASVVFEGIRVVLTEKLLGQARYNVMEALLYLGPFTFGALAVGAYAFEWEGLSTTGWELLRSRPADFLLATAVSFLVDLFCYLAIKYVSATSFKVAGCLKNVMVVWGGVLQGDVVTARELQGYMISLAGFVLFSASRWRAAVAGVARVWPGATLLTAPAPRKPAADCWCACRAHLPHGVASKLAV